ncbi:hypothetical protein HYE66_10565 [Aggregatibacter actinomycetemcomitans]|nr:hypothetical protein [Aggregatibacter actinomycetemcomitans]
MEIIAIGFVLIILCVVVFVFCGLFGAGTFQIIRCALDGTTRYFKGLYHFPLRGKATVGMWLYAIFMAYLVFLVLFVDFAVAGASVRVNGDIVNLRRMTNGLLGVCAVLINLPLLPLLFRFRALTADDRYLLSAQCIWQSIAFVIFVCCLLVVFMPLTALSVFVGKAFAVLWFWWADVMNWLDADNMQTINGFARPIFRHDRIFIFDLLMLAIMYLPFACFRSRLFPPTAAEENVPKLPQENGLNADVETK